MPSSIEYKDFLKRIIDDGIAAASGRFTDGSEELNWALSGFVSCEGLDPHDLRKLLIRSRQEAKETGKKEAATAVEWVCNCVSALLESNGLPVIIHPTVKGYFKTADVLGVSAGRN